MELSFSLLFKNKLIIKLFSVSQPNSRTFTLHFPFAAFPQRQSSQPRGSEMDKRSCQIRKQLKGRESLDLCHDFQRTSQATEARSHCALRATYHSNTPGKTGSLKLTPRTLLCIQGTLSLYLPMTSITGKPRSKMLKILQGCFGLFFPLNN